MEKIAVQWRLNDAQKKQVYEEYRDPRLYSNLRGMLTLESKDERIKAHKKLSPGTRETKWQAAKEGFTRSKEKVALSLDLISKAKALRTDRMLGVLNKKINHVRFGAKVPAQLEGSLINQQKKQFLLDRAEKAARMRQPGALGRYGRLSRGPGPGRDPGLLDKARTTWRPGMAPPTEGNFKPVYNAGADATVRRPVGNV